MPANKVSSTKPFVPSSYNVTNALTQHKSTNLDNVTNISSSSDENSYGSGDSIGRLIDKELDKVFSGKVVDPRLKRNESNGHWCLTQLSKPALSQISAGKITFLFKTNVHRSFTIFFFFFTEFAMPDSIDDELLSIDLDLSTNDKSFGNNKNNFLRHKSMPAKVSTIKDCVISSTPSCSVALKRKISEDNVGSSSGNKMCKFCLCKHKSSQLLSERPKFNCTLL